MLAIEISLGISKDPTGSSLLKDLNPLAVFSPKAWEETPTRTSFKVAKLLDTVSRSMGHFDDDLLLKYSTPSTRCDPISRIQE